MISYRQAGKGPAMVLLHGGMEDSRSWKWQLDGLSGDFNVLAWDAPGCGQSTDVPETWRFPDFADALAVWLRSLNVERPHIVGLSWGSSLALEFYRRHPDVPVSLILASAYAGWAGSLPTEEVAARLASVLSTADLSPDDLMKRVPGLVGSSVPPELIDEMMSIAVDNSAQAHPGGYRAMAHSMAEADLCDILPQIRIPVLLLYGELDERSPLSVARSLQSQIPDAQLAVIPGVGHSVNMEAPAEFNTRIREFISTI